MRKLGIYGALVGAILLAAGAASYAMAGGGKKQFRAGGLTGYEENPDISTAAEGRFQVTINDDAKTLAYTLSYSGLEGTVQQAHIHFGKRAINGGITVFLCSNLGNGPAGTPACPQEGTVARTVGTSDILAPSVGTTVQGIEAGNFAELVQAMRAGSTYANVHSTKWPGGEIRAQIKARHNDGDSD